MDIFSTPTSLRLNALNLPSAAQWAATTYGTLAENRTLTNMSHLVARHTLSNTVDETSSLLHLVS